MRSILHALSSPWAVPGFTKTQIMCISKELGQEVGGIFALMYLVFCRILPRKHEILVKCQLFHGPVGESQFSTQTSACHTDIADRPPPILNLMLIIPP